MEIVILQNEVSIGDKYQIFTDEQDTHTASRAMIQLLPVIELYLKGEPKPRMTMSKKVTLLKPEWHITRWDNIVLDFKAKNLWGNWFESEGGPEHAPDGPEGDEPVPKYDIMTHHGRKVSVFKNGTQVGWWDKDLVSHGMGDTFRITADGDCDRELIISFCLILDNLSETASERGSGSMVNFDLCNFGPQVIKFDETWQPKA